MYLNVVGTSFDFIRTCQTLTGEHFLEACTFSMLNESQVSL